MKFFSSAKNKWTIILMIITVCIVGCSKSFKSAKNGKEISTLVTSVKENDAPKETGESAKLVGKHGNLVPLKPHWQSGDQTFDPDNTVYYKTYYNDFVRGLIMDIKFPDINIQEEIEDYFIISQNEDEKMGKVVDLFFDNRTLEIDEEILKNLFYSNGYDLYFHNSIINDLHVRFIEINIREGVSLYPSRILIQTWDKEHIYLQDITGPIPRKIRSFIAVGIKEEIQLVIHSSGFSVDYISEEELSFWIFRDSYWILAPMDLQIDSTHAHNTNDMYPDEDRDLLFEPVYYKDGIVYRPSIQGDGLNNYTYRLGKLEETEKNKSFKLIAISEVEGRTLEDTGCYIEFKIN